MPTPLDYHLNSVSFMYIVYQIQMGYRKQFVYSYAILYSSEMSRRKEVLQNALVGNILGFTQYTCSRWCIAQTICVFDRLHFGAIRSTQPTMESFLIDVPA